MRLTLGIPALLLAAAALPAIADDYYKSHLKAAKEREKIERNAFEKQDKLYRKAMKQHEREEKAIAKAAERSYKEQRRAEKKARKYDWR